MQRKSAPSWHPGLPKPPLERLEPLPEVFPKPAIDDPDARQRAERLLSSPSYVRADQDIRFLNRDELRQARLQLEYLKTELALQAKGITSTIVLLGGTRILEPAAAARQVEHAEVAVAEHPGDRALEERLNVAKRVLAKSRYYDVAREFARMISQLTSRDAPGELVVTTGGGPGIMEAANRGAFDAGAETVGLNITLPTEQYPNAYITPDLCFQFRYFALRKLHFMKRAKALVAFPGGYGTMDELYEALCLVQTRTIKPIPIVLVGEKFWDRALDVGFLVEEGVISSEDRDIFCYAETAEDICGVLREWYADLIPPPE